MTLFNYESITKITYGVLGFLNDVDEVDDVGVEAI